VTGPDAQTVQRSQRLRVLLDIADRALRLAIADACEDAGIAVAADGTGEDADVVLIDRPVAIALPAVALAPDAIGRSSYRSWPGNVCAVVPVDTDADMLAAVITVVAAGYALTARRDADDAGGAGGAGNAEDAGADASDDAETWVVRGDAPGEPGVTLSAREREVLTLLAGGASNKEIALVLGLSVSTVKFHIAAITGKLGARSRVEAVAIAVRAGLVMV
jgi:DNA-binding NarL/FixJ family response regulator